MSRIQIQALPQGLTGGPLITALNDRLRRINDSLGGSSAVVPTATPPGTAGVAGAIYYGTHAQRSNRPVPADATLYVETDRDEVVYQVQVTAWLYISGIYRQTHSQLAALALTLTAADTGLLVYTTDTRFTYRWSGSAFVNQDNTDFALCLSDTHANRLANYPSVLYAAGQPFFETDRTVEYIVANAAGTVTVSGGTTVTWTAGNHFISSAQWPAGTVIVLAGVNCTVAAVSSPTVLTLSTATTNGSGVAYSVASGRWVYAWGTMQQPWVNMPTDLGENDVADAGGGLVFRDPNILHIWQWTASLAWTWGPGDRNSGEIALFSASPGAGWHLCDGTGSLTKYFFDGTRSTTFTVPNAIGGYLQAANSYAGSVAAAAAPGLTGSTASGAAAIQAGNAAIQPGAANIGNDSDAGSLLLVTAGATKVALNPHTHTDAGHTHADAGHAHTDAGHVHAKGTLAVDAAGTPATFAVLPYYRL